MMSYASSHMAARGCLLVGRRPDWRARGGGVETGMEGRVKRSVKWIGHGRGDWAHIYPVRTAEGCCDWRADATVRAAGSGGGARPTCFSRHVRRFDTRARSISDLATRCVIGLF
jgi:hypothetical protein